MTSLVSQGNSYLGDRGFIRNTPFNNLVILTLEVIFVASASGSAVFNVL